MLGTITSDHFDRPLHNRALPVAHAAEDVLKLEALVNVEEGESGAERPDAGAADDVDVLVVGQLAATVHHVRDGDVHSAGNVARGIFLGRAHVQHEGGLEELLEVRGGDVGVEGYGRGLHGAGPSEHAVVDVHDVGETELLYEGERREGGADAGAADDMYAAGEVGDINLADALGEVATGDVEGGGDVARRELVGLADVNHVGLGLSRVDGSTGHVDVVGRLELGEGASVGLHAFGRDVDVVHHRGEVPVTSHGEGITDGASRANNQRNATNQSVGVKLHGPLGVETERPGNGASTVSGSLANVNHNGLPVRQKLLHLGIGDVDNCSRRQGRQNHDHHHTSKCGSSKSSRHGDATTGTNRDKGNDGWGGKMPMTGGVKQRYYDQDAKTSETFRALQ